MTAAYEDYKVKYRVRVFTITVVLEFNLMTVMDPVCGMPLDPEKSEFKVDVWGRNYYFCSEYCMHNFLEGPRIAYFSMEIGIKSEIPTYSGGLGVLAGDTIRSSADLKIPLVAVTLVNRKGYLRQKITVSKPSPASFHITLQSTAL
jgi:YHS domain-containing protein